MAARGAGDAPSPVPRATNEVSNSASAMHDDVTISVRMGALPKGVNHPYVPDDLCRLGRLKTGAPKVRLCVTRGWHTGPTLNMPRLALLVNRVKTKSGQTVRRD